MNLEILLVINYTYGLLCACFRLPQYIYPGSYIAASPGVLPMSAAHSPLSPNSAGAASAGQMFDYSAAAAAAGYPANLQAAATAAAFEGYPYAVSAANYMNPAAAYSYAAAAVPQNNALAGFTAAYQPQQIQERMQ